MASIISDFEYDIFVSYRQNDNKRDGWVTEFVNTLQDELEATVKGKISIYFDENPFHGLGETHDVDDSLAKKLKCLIFIPIISKTYCDTNSFAWNNEFLAFKEMTNHDEYGLKVALPNGNTASRVLPIRIHDIDDADRKLVEDEIGFLRSIDFVYQSVGVNRPLRVNEDDPTSNLNKTFYLNQINKVANAIQEIISGIKMTEETEETVVSETVIKQQEKPELINVIKHRNILRTSLVYIMTALIIWKVTNIIVSVVDVYHWVINFFTLLLILLFPISLIMAWLYERSPKGFIRTGSVESRENPYTSSQKKPLTSKIFIILLVAISAALFAFFPKSNIWINNSNTTIIHSDKSIAVLYFDNISSDPEQDYFSDGITEEIIARLSAIEGLSVTSRTSVIPYKGQAINLREIAKQLNVENILEGSVRKESDKLRITAQLIDARTDKNIWTEVYDRDLADVFKIQSEIAHAIAEKFKIDVTPEATEKIMKPPTTNIKAYELYLKARSIPWVAGSGIGSYYGGAVEAISFLREAIELDPDYVQPYVLLSGFYLRFSIDPDPVRVEITGSYDSAVLLAKEAIIRAPMLADGYIALANTQDFESSIKWLLKACELDSLKGLLGLGNSYLNKAEFPKAIQCFTEAIKYGPNSYEPYLGKAIVYYNMAQLDSMNKYLALSNKMAPNTRDTYRPRLFWTVFSGNIEATRTDAKKYWGEDTLNFNKEMGIVHMMARNWKKAERYYLLSGYRDMDWGLVLINTGRRDEGIEVLKKALAYRGPKGWLGDLSRINAVLGNKEQAISEFKELIDSGWYELDWIRNDPFWDEIREEPGFKRIEEELERKNIEMLNQIIAKQNMKFSINI